MKGKVSLQQIADRVGLSKMTVSLALRDHPRIPERTQARIKAIAEEMGYRPNPEVSQFMSAIRRHTSNEQGLPLAYITTGERRGQWRESPTELSYWKGSAERAKTYGYYLEDHWLDEPLMSEHRLSDILWHRGIKGIIIPPMVRTLTEKLRTLRVDFDWERFAAVAIGDMLAEPSLNRVIHDHYTSILIAMEKLEKRGYRRIGLCLTEHMDLTVKQRWQAGYRVYRANHPIKRIAPLIEEDLTAEMVGGWVKKNQLDAIVSAERRMPDFLDEIGLEMGIDIAYADLDLNDDDIDDGFVCGIVQNSKLLGHAAVDLVVADLNRNHGGIPEVPFVLQVEGTWMEGQSAPARARGKELRRAPTGQA